MGTHPIFESDFDCLTDMPWERDYLIKDEEINVRFTDRTNKITSHVTMSDLDNFSDLKGHIILKLTKVAEERNLDINTDDLYLTDVNGCRFYSEDYVYLVYNDSEKIQVLYKPSTATPSRGRSTPKIEPEEKSKPPKRKRESANIKVETK